MDGCSERASELSMPGYQLKPSDRSKRNRSIKEHRGMVKKLNVIVKDSNGPALKQGEKFVHSLLKCKTDQVCRS